MKDPAHVGSFIPIISFNMQIPRSADDNFSAADITQVNTRLTTEAAFISDSYKPADLCANLSDLTTELCSDCTDLLHLCELVCTQVAGANLAFPRKNNISRLYVGSYFCDRFFLALDDAFFARLEDFCRTCNLKTTLVLPIFPQSTLDRGKKRIDDLLSRYPQLFDEITVNDYGMATHMAKLCTGTNMLLNWGRLFSREQRDPRYAETSYGIRPCLVDASAIEHLKENFCLGTIELDPFAPVIDISSIAGAAPVALHLPHCFMSTGHICEVASATLPQSQSFRANAPCAQECCSSFSVSISNDTADNPQGRLCYLIKSGRTVLFENPTCCIANNEVPERVIWSPNDFAFTIPEYNDRLTIEQQNDMLQQSEIPFGVYPWA